jgi:hypothetical protein
MCDENSDDFLVINSVQDGVNVCFRIQNLREMIPLLRTAKRVSLRVDRNGVLSVQLMVQHGEDTITFIEFLVRIIDLIIFNELFSCFILLFQSMRPQ